MRDLDTLDFKEGYLTMQILDTMSRIGMFTISGKASHKKDFQNLLEEVKADLENCSSRYNDNSPEYPSIYKPRQDYLQCLVSQNIDPERKSARYFFDKNLSGNAGHLDMTGILDWDIQYELDPQRNANKIMLIPL